MTTATTRTRARVGRRARRRQLGAEGGARSVPHDVEAATRAGIRAVAVRFGGRSDEDHRGASAIYDDPADLLAHLDELLGRG